MTSKYTYKIIEDFKTEIIEDAGLETERVIDRSGPWESEATASAWASAYTKDLNDKKAEPDPSAIEAANS